MTRRAALCLTLCLTLSSALLAVPRATCGAEAADLVLKNAVVHTVDAKQPRAEAVAVRANRIIAVGSTADVQAFVGPKTRVLDLRGRTVVPGFDDSHAHMLGIGFARLDVDLVGTRSYAEVVERVARAVKGRPAGEWVRGRGWHEGKWDAPAPGAVRGFPTHDALSAVSPDNPVVLERADGHAVLANAKAMAIEGDHARDEGPGGRRDHPRRRRARRPASSSTTRRGWSSRPSARRTTSAARSSSRWTSASRRASPA